MPKPISFWDHPVEKIEEALSIRKQIAALQEKLTSLFGTDDEESVSKARGPRKSGRRTMSAAGRASTVAAQKARWAKIKAGKSPVEAKPADAKSKIVRKKSKRKISPEGRARMAAAAKKRWADKKAKI